MHCASCGAPSVLGASRCPRCLAPFGAVGPMSGMVLAEEAPPAERPWGRWVGIGAVGVALLVGAGSWAMRRVRGTSSPEPVPAVRDTVAEAPVVPAPMPVESVRGDSVMDSVPVVAAPQAVTSASNQSSRPTGAARPAQLATPPATPPATPAPRPALGDTVYRATTWVWLRANPANTSEQLAVVNPNQVVQVLERRFGWVRVRIDGREGWMSADYLERVP